MQTIILSEIVDDTYTNASGFKLFTVLNNFLSDENNVSISFKGATPTSTSFLNSSIGELMDKYSMDEIKSKVKFIELNKSQVSVLRKYFDSCGFVA